MIQIAPSRNYLLVSEKINSTSSLRFKNFLIGALLYEVFNIFNALYSNIYMRIPEFFGLIVMIYSLSRIIKFRIENSYLKVLMFVYLACSITTILRLKNLSVDELRLMVFQPIHLLSYFVPLVIFIPHNVILSKVQIKYFVIICIILVINYLVIGLFLFPESNTADLAISPFITGAAMLYLLRKYINKEMKYLAVFTLLLSLYLGIENGRRNIILTSSSFIFLGWIMTLLVQKYSTWKKIINIIVVTLVMYFVYLNFDVNSFETLANRIDTDSRSEIFLSFYNDLSGADWIFGRGIDGTYYNPTNYWDFSNENSREVHQRDNIENGYLFMVLKGGLISLIIFLFIAIPAIYLGLFRSNNLVSKTFAIFLLVYLLDMFVFGQPTMSLKYMYVWISISICYSRKIRNLEENFIIKHLLK